jgi:hypothetical protein
MGGAVADGVQLPCSVRFTGIFFADHDVSADKILAVATAGTQPDRHVDRLEVLSKIFWKLFVLWNRLVKRQRRPTDHSMPA